MIRLLQLRADSLAQKFTGKAYRWITNFGPKLILAIILFLVGQWVIKKLNKGLKKLLSGKSVDATLRPFIQNFVQIILQVLLVLGLMQLLGIQMTLFAAFIGAIGVALGLALSGTMQNFASGILIILLKPFRVGDNIKTQGEEGTVTSIRLFYTVIRTFTNTTLIVPNSKLSNEVIFNLTLEEKRRIDISLKFKYDADFTRVEEILQKTLNELSAVLKDPPFRIGVDKIETDGYTVVLNVWVNAHGYNDDRMELNKKLMTDLKPFLLNTK